MLPILSWSLKFLSGFLPISGEKVGKILWVAGICLFVLIIWHKFTAPTQKTIIEKVDTQIVNQCQPDKSIIRLKLWKIFNISCGE